VIVDSPDEKKPPTIAASARKCVGSVPTIKLLAYRGV